MLTMLVVDDEKIIADGLCEMLSDVFANQIIVLRCYSSADALQIAAQKSLDILLTDINMPDISGLELHLSIIKLHPLCKVIYLTGYSQFEYARSALEQKAFAYVLKGEGDERVIQVVQEAAEEALEGAGKKTYTKGDAFAGLNTYIQYHLSADLSLNRLADYVHLHPVYLSRIYKETTGQSLSDYILQVKMAEAKKLLSKSSMSVIKISKALGFASDNYFCRWFRKNAHITPQKYRAEHRERKPSRQG